ncbi:hypothetical 66.3 kda protein in hag2 5'region [Gluconobacter frateurii NBRC 103465]|nr:hypothetical 66.3 kda protein in hag2 5'region [Gluconobacter frateurii NBRC 103465]
MKRSSGLCHDLFCHVTRHRIVVVELHGEGCTTLRCRTQMGNVAEHFLQRHLCADHHGRTRRFLALDDATATVKIAHDVTDVVVRRRDFHVHDWLKDHRTGVLHAFTEAGLGSDFEGQSRRVNVMVLTVKQRELEVHRREASENTRGALHPDALFDCRNVFLRNRTADNLVREDDLVRLVRRSELDLDFSVLTRTTRLLLVGVGLNVRLRDRLTISHLRCTDVSINAVFTTQTVNNDVQVKLTHAGQDGLTRFLIRLEVQGRIFSRQLLQRQRHLLDGVLGLRLDRDVDNRNRELHTLQNHRISGISQRVTRDRVLQTNERSNVTRTNGLHFLTLVSMHLEHAADAFLVTLRRVQDRVTSVQNATVDANEGQRAVLVGDDLERKASKLSVWINRNDWQEVLVNLFAFRRSDADAFNFVRSRQVVDNGIEQRLNALVLKRGTTHDRTELTGDRTLLDALLQRGNVNVTLLEVLFHGFVVHGERRVQKRLASFFSLFLQVSWDFFVVELGAEFAAFPDDGAHLNEIDNTNEVFFSTDWQLQRNCNDVQLLFQRAESVVEVCTRTVELVDEDDARNVIAVSKTPVGLGLRLHACNTFDHEDGAIEHAERTVHFDVEVNVARGVDDIDAVVVPLTRHGSGRDGDAALTLLRHVIGGGVAVVDFTDLMGDTRVVQDALGRGGLTSIDMCGNTDVADLRESRFGFLNAFRHGEPPKNNKRCFSLD